MNAIASPAEVPASADLDSSYVVVAPYQLAEFQKRLGKLNAKAEKFGLPPITILSNTPTVYERESEMVGGDMDRILTTLRRLPEGVVAKNPVIMNRLKIEYPEVKLGNWQVVGRLEAFEETNLLFAVTDREDDRTQVRAASLQPICCEHCNSKRKRKESFILRDLESGEYKQVGSSCLEDHTGIDPAAALFLAKMYEMVRVTEGEADEFGRAGRANAVSTLEYLSHVSFLVERHGFVSAAKARDGGGAATYSDAIDLPYAMQDSRDLAHQVQAARAENDAKAQAVREWYAAKSPDSDFDRNVQLLLSRDYLHIDSRHLALAAASVAQYNREHQAELERKAPSRHIGTPGQKMSGLVTIDRVLEIDNPYAYNARSFILLMRDELGNRVKWKTSAATQEMVNGAGRTMSASFKVSKHDEYKGQLQTTVTHLKLDRWMDVSAEAAMDQEEVPKHSLRDDLDLQCAATVESMRQAIVECVGHDAADLARTVGGLVVTTSRDPYANPGFRKWFADSKVVDAMGVPQVAFHGTNASFEKFARDKLGRRSNSDTAFFGMYFTTDPVVASEFANGGPSGGENVIPAYLAIRNPRVVSAAQFQQLVNFADKSEVLSMLRSFRGEGIDGLRILPDPQLGAEYSGDTWVAFSPNQVKSAISNVGTYSRRNASILHSVSDGVVQAWHDDARRVTTFVVDQIPAGRETAVFLHEVVHRHGRGALPAGTFDYLVGQVNAWAKRRDGTVEREIYGAAARRVARARVSGPAAEEELFAYAVEEALVRGVKPSAAAAVGSAQAWLQVVVESIQRIGEKLIGNALQGLDGQDLVDLAYALAQVDSPEHGFEVRRALAMSAYPEILQDAREIASFMDRHAGNSDFDAEFAREYFAGAKAVKRLLPVTSLVLGHSDANRAEPNRQAACARLSPETVPPIIVECGEVKDGSHRLRDALARGITHMWCYDVVDEAEPIHAADFHPEAELQA